MNLPGCSVDELTRTKEEYEAFLRDPASLKELQEFLKATPSVSDSQRKVFAHMEKTFKCYATPGGEADQIRTKITKV